MILLDHPDIQVCISKRSAERNLNGTPQGQGGLHGANEREHPFCFSFVTLRYSNIIAESTDSLFDMKGISESLKTQLCLGQHMFVSWHIKIKDVKSKM